MNKNTFCNNYDEVLKNEMKSLILPIFDGKTFKTGKLLDIFRKVLETKDIDVPDLQKQYNIFYAAKGELENEGLIKAIKHGVYYVSSEGVRDYKEEGSDDDMVEEDEEMLEFYDTKENSSSKCRRNYVEEFEELENSLAIEDDEGINEGTEIIGNGDGEVYVYYYPAYRALANEHGESNYRCKIGMTKVGFKRRWGSAARTDEPENRELALIIKTDHPCEVEKLLHMSLIVNGKRLEDTPGKEWFLTNPAEIRTLYESNMLADKNKEDDDMDDDDGWIPAKVVKGYYDNEEY